MMTSINTVEEDKAPFITHRTQCSNSNDVIDSICDTDDLHDNSSELENAPLITYQSHSNGVDSYLTDIHCHESKPIYSNARARRKLLIASIVCLLFVVAEVVGKSGRFNNYSMSARWIRYEVILYYSPRGL